MSVVTFTEQIVQTFEVITCPSCDLRFGVPKDWIQNKRKEAGSFMCPSGCGLNYSQSESDRLRKQLEAAERDLRAAKCDVLSEQQKRAAIETEKAKVERKLKRVNRGVCPCCTRTFENLQRHMATKHAEKTPAK